MSCGAWHGEFLDLVGFDVGPPGIGIILALLWLIVMFLELFLSSFVAWLDAAIREAVGRQKCLQKRSQKKSTCMDVNRKINLSTT